jgi:gas vesicle protein
MVKLMTVAAIGAVAGAAATLAMSPETREKLKDRFSSAKDDVEGLVEKGKKAVKDVAQVAKDEYNGLVDDSKKAVNHNVRKTQEDLKTT